MKIAIFSDSHDNLYNIDLFLNFIQEQKIDQIICCGDITTVDTLGQIVTKCDKTVHLVTGNADNDDNFYSAIDVMDSVLYYDKFGEVSLDNLNLAFVHYPGEAKKLAQTKKYDYVFYGHTHMPWREQVGDCHVVNPGTLAGLFFRASFAIFNTANGFLELKLIDRLYK